MFNLAIIDDTVRLEAAQLSLDTITALTYNINAKYSNRILPNVGLCVSHFDYSDISEGHLRNGDGCTYYKVTFRLIVFRPFKGEVLIGRVKSCDEYGIRITLGFFDDIFVSGEALLSPSAYDHSKAEWFVVWEPEDERIRNDPLLSREDERLYIEKGEAVRFLIDGDEFNEPEPPGPSTWGKNAINASSQQGGAEINEVESATKIAPYRIKVSECGHAREQGKELD
jgi:DNA-directed RNA polymerase III subunit RPC8